MCRFDRRMVSLALFIRIPCKSADGADDIQPHISIWIDRLFFYVCAYDQDVVERCFQSDHLYLRILFLPMLFSTAVICE